MHLIHKYKIVNDNRIVKYLECSDCGKRKIRTLPINGYTPIDQMWLEGQSLKSTSKQVNSESIENINTLLKKSKQSYSMGLSSSLDRKI